MKHYVPELGKLAAPEDKRDAIHVAVAPVVAGNQLWPGTRVRLNDNGRAVRTDQDDWIGIVDPFLGTHVNTGEWLWLLMRPNTVTGLRHVWSHKAFTPKVSE